MLEQTEIYQAGFLVCVVCSIYAALQPSVLLAILCVTVGFACFKFLQRKFAKRMSPTGRSVLITGCDTGIGLELAKRLNEERFTVIATCLQDNGQGARELKKLKGGRMHVLGLDVTSDDSVDQCVTKTKSICKQTGGLWAVVNNAGIVSFGDIELTTMEVFKKVVDVNLFGVIRVTKAFLPLIRKVRGRVINVTSVKGICAYPCFSAYNMTKFGAESLTDTLRLEMKKYGVKVIAVEPGNFGGTTGLWSDENTVRLRREMSVMKAAASDEILTTYGDDRLSHLLSVFKDGATTSHPNLDPLMDDLVDALTNECPAYRYTTHGGQMMLDIDVIVSLLRSYLPVSLHDYLVLKFRGIPEQQKD